MSPGKRNLLHADGRAAVLAGDTAWGLPWRATHEQCRVYAADRQAKGFNAVLLMSVQPDMDARGPRERGADEGFDVGFEDLPDGHINQLNPAYFQYLDKLVEILVEHEIVPVWQPVFHGFGWKGLRTAGPVVPPAEYARYCRYLVARYGARPAIYLVGGDGSGREPQIAAGGEEVEAWDAYQQPTGIHYRPHIVADASQERRWLDFQWCQTGHTASTSPNAWPTCGATCRRRRSPTASRPTSMAADGTRRRLVAGARSVEQPLRRRHDGRRLRRGQPLAVGAPRRRAGPVGLLSWRRAAGWREALDFEGSRYVGLVARTLDGLPLCGHDAELGSNAGPARAARARQALHLLQRGRRPAAALWRPGAAALPHRPAHRRSRAHGVRPQDQREWIPGEWGAPRLYIFCDE